MALTTEEKDKLKVRILDHKAELTSLAYGYSNEFDLVEFARKTDDLLDVLVSYIMDIKI